MHKKKFNHCINSPFLEDLLEAAGDADHAPAPFKIPKRWLFSWIGYALKCFVLPYVLIDEWMKKLARKIIRPPFQQIGTCKRRGNCCYYILIPELKSFWGRLFLIWHTQVHGFYMRYKTAYLYEGKKMLVMGCRYLKKNGSCGQYFLRPQICRQWPLIERFGYPKILKGCGYASKPPYPQEKSENLLGKDPRLKVLN